MGDTKTDYVSIYGESMGKVSHRSMGLSKGTEPFFPFKIEPASGGKKYDNTAGYTFDGIITDFTIDKSELIAVTPTLGSDIYLYVGGESAWEITLGGIAFTDCKVAEGTEGFKNIVNFYCKNNIAYSGKPCKLIIGNGTTYKAYLTAFRINSVKKIDGIYPFLFKFYAIKHNS